VGIIVLLDKRGPEKVLAGSSDTKRHIFLIGSDPEPITLLIGRILPAVDALEQSKKRSLDIF